MADSSTKPPENNPLSTVEKQEDLEIDDADLIVPESTAKIIDMLQSNTSSRKGRLRYLTGMSGLANLPPAVANYAAMKHLVDIGISSKIAAFCETNCGHKKSDLLNRATALSLAFNALGRIAVNQDLRTRILADRPQLLPKMVSVVERFSKSQLLVEKKHNRDYDKDEACELVDAEAVFNQLIQWSEDDNICVALCKLHLPTLLVRYVNRDPAITDLDVNVNRMVVSGSLALLTNIACSTVRPEFVADSIAQTSPFECTAAWIKFTTDQEVLLRAISFIACMGGKKLPDGTAPYAKKIVKAIGNLGYLLALLQYPNEQITLNARRILTLFNQGARAVNGKLKEGEVVFNEEEKMVFQLRAKQLLSALQGNPVLQQRNPQSNIFLKVKEAADAKKAAAAKAAKERDNDTTQPTAGANGQAASAGMLLLHKCAAPICANVETAKGQFRACGRCRSAVYCSAECQKSHWKAGHKAACQQLQEAAVKSPQESIQTGPATPSQSDALPDPTLLGVAPSQPVTGSAPS